MPSALTALAIFLIEHAFQAVACLAAMLAIFTGFLFVGRLFGERELAVAILVGWATVYLVALVTAFLWLSNLLVTLLVFGALIIASVLVIRRDSSRLIPLSNLVDFLPTFVLSLPLLVLGSVLPSLYWDSYMHWLPNALYLHEFGHLPIAPLDDFPSVHPTYPVALPIIIYMASYLTGEFAEVAGPLTNVLLSLAAIVYVHSLIWSSLPASALRGDAENRFVRRVLPITAFCVVILLNPAIQWVHYFSALADPALAVVVLVTIGKWCQYLVPEDSEQGDGVNPRAIGSSWMDRGKEAAVLFMLGILIVGIKQSGWQVAAVLAAAGSLLGIIRRIPVRRWGGPVLAVGFGAVVASLTWRGYLGRELPLTDQFSLLPLENWRFDLVETLLSAIQEDITTYWSYYGLAAVVLSIGLVDLCRRPVVCSRLRLMVGFVTLSALAHFGCLIAAYLGTGFHEWEIARAASLQRYTSQFGFAVCVIGLASLAVWVIPRFRHMITMWSNNQAALKTATTAGAAVLLAIYVVVLLHPTLALAHQYQKYRATARQSAVRALETFGAGERVAVVGDKWSVHLARYASWADIPAARRPVVADLEFAQSPEHLVRAKARIDGWMADSGIESILLLDAAGLAAGMGLAERPDQVWRRSSKAWRVVDLGRTEAR